MSTIAHAACWLGLAAGTVGPPGEVDTDRDGLSDFHEIHKHLTDPKKADTDGDGVPDGDWSERREYAYTVRAVMHVMSPFDTASMNDDYQDVRVLTRSADLLEFEVVVYPFNTVSDAITASAAWRKPASDLQPFVAAGPCCNWDKRMQSELLDGLKQAGIDVASLTDADAAKRVSKWLLERARYEDSFTTFAVEFADGKPRVCERQRENVAATLKRFGRTLDEQWNRELFGKGMFDTRTRGSCTSSAIYLSTGLKAIGLPTRTVVCVPVVDANDEREVDWIDARITHVGVREILKAAASAQRGSWTSHTFNEVFVGNRWRRLNYTRLGQNVLDKEYLGLMVHVHTYVDHASAGLSGWGNREAHPLHAALFGAANPYSCIGLSDQFGVHASVPNESLAELREVAIQRIYWYDDPQRDPKLETELSDRESCGYLFAHLVTRDVPGGGSSYMEFFSAADMQFALRARGRDDVPARGIQKYWIDGDRDLNDFILRIEPNDFARMDRGVEYELVWVGKDTGLRWKVMDGVTITRARP